MATNDPEIEEVVEASLVARLSASCALPVEGFLAPADAGTAKNLSADSFIGVKVDQSSQDGDYAYRAPFTHAAVVTVRCAMADDASGALFREACRRVRAVLLTLTGDGCAALSTAAYACASFTLDATSSSFEGGDEPVRTKAYTATIKGRVVTPSNTTEAT